MSVVFLGSAHPPNTEAARYIVENIAGVLPEMDFHLIGALSDAIRHLPMPPNVILHGVLSEDRKTTLLESASVAINPMASGGGSSLKQPDFLRPRVPSSAPEPAPVAPGSGP